MWAIGHESMVDNFDLVVLMPFRNIHSSIQETIQTKYNNDTTDKETINKSMNDNTKRILFLLDGYDESSIENKSMSHFFQSLQIVIILTAEISFIW